MSLLLEQMPARPVAGVLAGLLAGVLLLAGCASAGPYQGMNLQEVFDIAMQHMEDEEWDEAIEAFETVVFAAEGLESAAPARFYMAEALYHNEEYVTAAAEYERFLARFPTHEFAPAASLGICRSYVALSPIIPRDQTDTEIAYQACANTSIDFRGTPEAEIAADLRERMWEKLAEKTFETGEFYFDLEAYDSALIYYQDVVANFPGTPAAPRALERMYMAYQEIGYEEEAEETRQRLLGEYPDSEAARSIQERTSNTG